MSQEILTDPPIGGELSETSDEFFSLPSNAPSSDYQPKEDSYVLMETVSLETSADSAALNVHFKVSSQEENTSNLDDPQIVPENVKCAEVVSEEAVPLSLSPSAAASEMNFTPLSLSQYFESAEPLPVHDIMGHTFFDSLSSGLSPMMKSVADITSLDTGVEIATEATSSESSVPAESSLGQGVDDPKAVLSVSPTVVEPEMSEIGAHEVKGPEEQSKPLLSILFSEEKSGSDLMGKAFFDSISNQPCFESSPPAEADMSPLSAGSNGPRSQDLLYLDPQEKDQFYDAWIPSPQTKQVLVAMSTASQGSFFPEKTDLTMPGLVVTEQMQDPVKKLMLDLEMEGAQTRQCLTADLVPQDENGLRQLIKSKCFGAAINLTGHLLSAIGQGPGTSGHPTRHSPYSLQLWYTRMALFVKTRKFQYAEAEGQAFGDLDKPDIYYEFYPDVFIGRKGSMASFSFRLLLAECPQFLGNYCGALDRLYSLLAVVQKIVENLDNGLAEDGENVDLSEQHRKASLQLWKYRECRVLFSVLNCMISQKDYAMAMDVIHILQGKVPSKAAEMESALGKIYLQLGDVHAATTCFNKVSVLRNQTPPTVKHAVEDLVHKALMCIVQNSYGDAYKHFSQALALQPDNTVLTNNMAVCLLYMGRLKEAITLMEGVVMRKPGPDGSQMVKMLHEGLLFNTCILYELESFRCDIKKKEVLCVVGQHVGDAFQTVCLKIDVKALK